MQKPGQTTSFQVRLEMMEQASAGVKDTQIAINWRLAHRGRYASGDEEHSSVAASVWPPRWDVLPLVKSSTFPQELQEAILHLRKLHPGWGPATLLVALKMDVSSLIKSYPHRLIRTTSFFKRRIWRALSQHIR
jgi:hypothetical protein